MSDLIEITRGDNAGLVNLPYRDFLQIFFSANVAKIEIDNFKSLRTSFS